LRQTGSTAGPVPFTKHWWARAGSGTGAPAVAPSARLSRPRAVAPRVVLSDTREVAGSNQSCPRSRQPGRTRTRAPHSAPGRTQVPRIRARYAGSARRRVRCTISDAARVTPTAREPARLPRRTPHYCWRSQRYPCPRISFPDVRSGATAAAFHRARSVCPATRQARRCRGEGATSRGVALVDRDGLAPANRLRCGSVAGESPRGAGWGGSCPHVAPKRWS
jgi:hypothetical protein